MKLLKRAPRRLPSAKTAPNPTKPGTNAPKIPEDANLLSDTRPYLAPVQPKVETREEKSFKSLLEWFEQSGGTARWIKIGRCDIKDTRQGRRGLFLSQKVYKGQILVVAPYSLMFGAKDHDLRSTQTTQFRKFLPWGHKPVAKSPLSKQILELLPTLKMSGDELTFFSKCLLFLREYELGESSNWNPWIRLLPEAVRNFPLFTETERISLRCSHAGKLLQTNRDSLLKAIQLLRNLSEQHPKIFPPSIFPINRLAWAWSLLLSRTISEHYIIPIIDFINFPDKPPKAKPDYQTELDYNSNEAPNYYDRRKSIMDFIPNVAFGSANVELKWFEDEQIDLIDRKDLPLLNPDSLTSGVKLVATRDIEEDEELFLPYGNYENGDLLMRYGFVIPVSYGTYKIRISKLVSNLRDKNLVDQLTYSPLTLVSRKPIFRSKDRTLNGKEFNSNLLTKKHLDSKKKVKIIWDFEFSYYDERLQIPDHFLPAFRVLYGPPRFAKLPTLLPERELLSLTENTEKIDPKALTVTFKKPQIQPVYDVNYPYPYEDERRVITMARKVIKKRLRKYPTSLASDLNILARSDLPKLRRMIVFTRHSEKFILHRLLHYLNSMRVSLKLAPE